MMTLLKVESEQPSDNVDPSVRKGEDDKFWFRSDRFFKVGDQWYFTTREQRDVGPYASRADAEHGLGLFIECLEKQHTNFDYAISVALQGDWALVRYQ